MLKLKEDLKTSVILITHDLGVIAVDGVSLHIDEREILGLVGESGCGKSTLGKVILRLLEPTGRSIFYYGHDDLALVKKEHRFLREKMQIIFQDPF